MKEAARSPNIESGLYDPCLAERADDCGATLLLLPLLRIAGPRHEGDDVPVDELMGENAEAPGTR